MIRVDGVSVVFNAGTALENRVLDNFSVDVPQGQFVTVIGSNGAGKSTLLNVLAGEVAVASGRVLIAEQDVTRLPASERAGLVARVFQDPRAGTCETLTVEEQKLTALMVTHSMRHALALGDRTLMLHECRVVLDVAGSERKSMTVDDLIARFRAQHGEELDSDSLLLA